MLPDRLSGWRPLLAGIVILAGNWSPARAQPAPAPPSLDVSWDAGTLTVEANNVTLGSLLAEIGLELGIVVWTDGPLDETVGIRFERQPLGIGLDRILGGRSFVLKTGPGSAGPQGSLTVLSGVPDTTRQILLRPRVPQRSATDAVPDAIAAIDAEIAGSIDRDAVLASLAVDALYDEQPRVREEAAYAIAEFGGAETLPLLMQILRDPVVEVRVAAVVGLGAMNPEEATAALIGALSDASPVVREEAVLTMAEIRDEASLRAISAALGDPDPDVREAAASVLAN